MTLKSAKKNSRFSGLYDSLLNDEELLPTDAPTARHLVRQWLEMEVSPEIAASAQATISKSYASNSIPEGQKGVPVHLSTDPEHIAAELSLKPNMTIDEIDELRRTFALRNHPDRVNEALIQLATVRMQIANAILDALKKSRSL